MKLDCQPWAERLDEQRLVVQALEDSLTPPPGYALADLGADTAISLIHSLEREREVLRRMEAEEKSKND